MLGRSLFILALLAWFIAVSFADEQPAVKIEQGQFSTPDRYSKPALSPDGSKVAFVRWDEGTEIVVYDITDPEQKQSIATLQLVGRSGAPFPYRQYSSLRWLDERKLFIDWARPFIFPNSGHTSHRGQFYVFDLETKELNRPFIQFFRNQVHRALLDQSTVVHWPQNEKEPLLLALYSPRSKYDYRPHVYEIDPVTMETERVVESQRHVGGWLADHKGKVRVGFERRKNDERGAVYRAPGERRWKEIKAATITPGKTFDILGFTENSGAVYVASNHEGEPAGLYRFDLASETFGEKIAGHDRYDVTYVRLDRDGGLLAASAGGASVYLDKREKRYLEVLSEAVDFNSRSLETTDRADTKRIYWVRSANTPGAYYLLNTVTEQVTKLADKRSEDAKGIEFGQTWQFSFEARDGLELDSFVALPAGLTPETAKSIPFVMMPHGGPWSRDFASFDPLTQFVNSLGIGVLKVNFRGSEGYGASFEELGVGEWGQAMQEDINDALRWGIDQGWVDPSQVCIVGWSYGGYASLMASIDHAEDYKCAASIAGVTDLVELIRDTRDEEILRRVGAKHRYDKDAVIDVSPLHRADEIAIPLFLAHGSGDTIVNITDHYINFLSVLREHERDVDFVGFLNGDHALSLMADREILYQRLGAFLTSHLGSDQAVTENMQESE